MQNEYEVLHPRVQVFENIAVLTFNYISYNGQKQTRWSCTEVYRRNSELWKIIQTHWSYTRHPGIVQD